MRMALRNVGRNGSKWILVAVLFPVCILSGCTTPATIPGRNLVRPADAVGVPGEPKIESSERKTMVEIPDTAMASDSATQVGNPKPLTGQPTAQTSVQLSPSAAVVVNDVPASRKSSPTAATTKSPQLAATGGRKPELDAIVGMTKNYTGKPISLDLQEAEIKNVLRLLADVSGTNIAIEPDVEGRVTLKVNRVPWDQVLDMILAMNNLGKDQFRGVIRVARQEKLKKELQEKDAEIRARQQVLESSREVGEIATHYLQVNYAKAADIANKIVLSNKGKLTVDERTNLILCTDYPSWIQAARDLLKRLDLPTPQVLIEARIVQLDTNAVKDLGIDWSFGIDRLSGGDSHRLAGPDSLRLPVGLSLPNFQVNQPVAGLGDLGASLFGFSFGQIAGQTLWNIDMKISALETAGKGKIISAPRVLTLNNVEASISAGKEIPYLKLNEFGVSTTEFKDAVLELKVTPQITPDQKLSLKIDAKKERADFSQLVGTSGLPPIDTRKVSTTLLVADGDTIVIGGILEEEESYSESRTPGLGQVPILGALFKAERTRKNRAELLIFISPRITALAAPVRQK
jgi:type IV pilus assembly protein PilQ